MTDPGPKPPNPAEDLWFSYKSLLRNYLSLSGLALAAIALANIIILFIIDVTSAQPSPYTGILAYMVLPGFLVAGLVLAVIGVAVERHRRLQAVPGAPLLPKIDLNQSGQRRRLESFVGFVVVFILLSAVGSYRAYEFTDSTTFCGELCHTVMHPEHVAHDHSAHARVTCVECHVGSGASWYVKSKMSGLRQVYRTITNTYPRPIETPVANLRPPRKPASSATGRAASGEPSSRCSITFTPTKPIRRARFACSSRPVAAIRIPARPRPESTGT